MTSKPQTTTSRHLCPLFTLRIRRIYDADKRSWAEILALDYSLTVPMGQWFGMEAERRDPDNGFGQHIAVMAIVQAALGRRRKFAIPMSPRILIQSLDEGLDRLRRRVGE